jgi:Fe-S-cluster containining protein
MYFEKFCSVCPESVHCCKFKGKIGFTFLTEKDAERIKKKTEMGLENFVDFSPLPKKMIKALKDDDPLLEGGLRYFQLDKKNRIMRLKTKEDGRCIFLTDEGRCSIYSVRPNICRIYPFWGIRLLNRKIKIIGHDISPKCGILKSIKKKNKDLEASLSKKELEGYKKIFQKIEKEKQKIV